MSDTDPLIGQRISNYEITRRLGQGGMGVVYLARHMTLETDVAIKFLAVQLATDPSYVERFLREARAAARLHHSNLITVHDAGMEGEIYYMVMEFVEGEDLLKQLRGQRVFTQEEVIYLGVKTAEALGYAHGQGLIHRDIKPENLILTSLGEVKVADLGLAKQLHDENASMTMSGMVVGTPYYISPEQVRGLKEVDARTDIYSLGVTMFHLATGQVPFKGNSSAEIMSKHLTEAVPDARSINPALSEELNGVLSKMMAKDPGDRIQSMAEVCLALDAVAHGRLSDEDSATVIVKSPVRKREAEEPRRVLRVPTLPPDQPAGTPAPLHVPTDSASPAPVHSDSPAAGAETPPPAKQPPQDVHKLKLREEPVMVAAPVKKESPVGKVVLLVLVALAVGAGYYFYPRLQGTVDKAKTQITTHVANASKPKLSPLELIISQKLQKNLSDVSTKDLAAGNVKFDMGLDAQGAVVTLKPTGDQADSNATLAGLVEKTIRASAPFTRTSGENPPPSSQWAGSLDIDGKMIQATIQRPLNASEKNTQRELSQALGQVTRQISTLETELAQKPPEPPPEGGGSQAGGGLKGDFKGGLSGKFVKPESDAFRNAEFEQRKKDIAVQLENLKRQQQQYREQLTPFESGKMSQIVSRLEFTVQATPSASASPQ